MFPEHSKWSSLGDREMNRQKSEPLVIFSADYLQSIKRLIISTELFSVLTVWVWLYIVDRIMQSAKMIYIYSVQYIVDCLPVSVSTETVLQ